jgi:uncharacterized protein (DUF302 family)
MHEGIRTCISQHSFNNTLCRLQAVLVEKRITLFCLIDHSGLAEATGVRMPPTRLLIFGSPKAGTPLMLAAPSTALDLPLKLLIAEQADGQVLLSWDDPEWLQQRHGFTPELRSNIEGIEALARRAAE